MATWINPKKNRMMYASITDHINKFPYKLIDIPSYTEELSDYELATGPIRTPIPGSVSSGMFTINWMIQAYHDHTPFTFARPSDVCHVAFKLEEYTKALSARAGTLSKDEQAYADKALIFLSEIKKQAVIVLARAGKLNVYKDHSGDSLFGEFLNAAKPK